MKSPVSPSVFFKHFKSRTRAGVLQLTLGIAVIIAVLCSAIILLAYYSRIGILNSQIRNSLRDNAESGIQYLMGSRETFPLNQEITIDLFNEEIDSVTIRRLPWGLFEVYSATATRGSKHYTKTAIITAAFSDDIRTTLCLPENHATVYLAGTASVSGIISMSERQFSAGNAGGRTFEGKKMPAGNFRISDNRMPELDTAFVFQVRQWLTEDTENGQLFRLAALPESSIFQFSGNRINFFSQSAPLELRDSLQGNLIIKSSTSIKVFKEAYLSDVVVIAPVIEIERGFHGRAQFFASKLIQIGEETELHYPSVLALIGQSTDSLIQIGKNSHVEGIVLIPGYNRNIESEGLFKLENGSVFQGVAYVNASSDIQGSFWGHLTTKRVQARVGDAVYYNHILDADLSFEKKSPDMPASLLWGNGPANVVARWVE
ncbi:MAG: hypothetical protein JNJ75_09055 [Cyclobacteriaceae bacterium]|nr:hypothetical protein [Cyclobacteriaceae bacterium]